jgi:hypothetical protein
MTDAAMASRLSRHALQRACSHHLNGWVWAALAGAGRMRREVFVLLQALAAFAAHAAFESEYRRLFIVAVL